jgi:parvulin-like peptidyl-prolyl isomerase
MQFLAEDVASAREPASEELREWFAANRDQFALPARVSFRHLYFSPDTRGARARDDAAAELAKLAGKPQAAARPADKFMFQDSYRERSAEELAREFGPPFAKAVVEIAPGSWQGPLQSGYGWHLVFVDSAVPARTPEFEEVEPDVKTAWLADQKERVRREAYEAMRAKYTVVLPAPPAAPSAKLDPPP